jgi:hypothetical protein
MQTRAARRVAARAIPAKSLGTFNIVCATLFRCIRENLGPLQINSKPLQSLSHFNF